MIKKIKISKKKQHSEIVTILFLNYDLLHN